MTEFILARLGKEVPRDSMEWMTDNKNPGTRLMRVGEWRWQVSFREVSHLPPSDWYPCHACRQFWMAEQFETVFILHGSSILVSNYCWWQGMLVSWQSGAFLLRRGVLSFISQYDFDGFRQISQACGASPRLEIFPGQQETCETPRPQMGYFTLLIPRFWWTTVKRVGGGQIWCSVPKANK